VPGPACLSLQGIAFGLQGHQVIKFLLQLVLPVTTLRFGPLCRGALHALHGGIVTRRARRNPSDFYAQAYQPQHQLRHRGTLRIAKRFAVIYFDFTGQPPVFKNRYEPVLHLRQGNFIEVEVGEKQRPLTSCRSFDPLP